MKTTLQDVQQFLALQRTELYQSYCFKLTARYDKCLDADGDYDLHTIDMEDFKYGKTNITGFRLVDENNADLQGLVVELNTKWSGAIRKLDFPIKTIRKENCKS
ncbi:UNVERIFIED_CONTAM: hypothetical protein NCL1_08365 [Trichonephila clavipes]